MKRATVILVVFGLLFGSLVAAADAKKKVKKVVRVVEIPYTGGNFGVSTPVASGGACFGGTPAFTCQSAATSTKDRYVTVEVVDASGQKAGGFISQVDSDGDGLQDGYGTFCGAHPAPIALTHPGTELGISLYPGACEDGSPSIVTTGTIKVTFSNMP